MSQSLCGSSVCWWDGEYEGECELSEGHKGDHFDGLSWFSDAGENTDEAHRGQAMDEWVTLFANRDEVAEEYASCLRDFPPEWDRWADFNAAILRRWSPAGLRYIKEKAWKVAAV